MAKTREAPILGALTERELGEYARFFERNRLEELTVEEKGLRLTMRKQRAPAPSAVPVVSAIPVPAAPSAAPAATAAAPAPAAAPKVEKKPSYKEIRSPIVGTFYAASAPGAPAYVKVGDHVTPDTKVCIIEAMKVMNEIKSGVTGKVVEILVQNAQSVTANQVLIHIE